MRTVIRKWLFVAGVTLIVICAARDKATAQSDKDAVSGSIHHEIQTMARVIEERIDESNNGAWRSDGFGASIFGSKVSAMYLPTVGAVFTIKVSFPLTAPPEPATTGEDEEESRPEDLWDRHSRNRNRRGTRAYTSEARGLLDEALVWYTARTSDDSPKVVRKTAGTERTDGGADRRKRFVVLNRESDFAYGYFSRGQQQFDASKADSVRNTVLETVGLYGYRMEHLPKNERLLIIIEGPKARAVRPSGFGELGGLRADLNRSIAVYETDEFLRVGRRDSAEKDRWLLSFEAGFLDAEHDLEKMQKAVEQTTY